MIPASAEHGVASAGDDVIFADILRSFGRDADHVVAALTYLTRIIPQCYYRDDRVMRSPDMEVRPPLPKGFEVEQGDWSLLEPVRARPKLFEDAP